MTETERAVAMVVLLPEDRKRILSAIAADLEQARREALSDAMRDLERTHFLAEQEEAKSVLTGLAIAIERVRSLLDSPKGEK